ncbi:MAG: long-chain acyl-CoA synthetase [Pseudonocardiales bacterium]|jgi:long-chain acyl-CoA synthetase|nr:long-chain acyl-CoA synthetase [Pseudonocardiales bacterium]
MAHPYRGVSDLLRARAAETPDRLALVAGDTRWSWSDFDAAVSAASAALLADGAAAGDRIALHLPTGAPFAQLYLAILRAGLVAVPLNPAYADPEVEFIRADSGASRCFDRESAAEFLAGAAAAHDPGADRGGEALAVLLYTSGTSGRPRGAMLSARALLANLDQAASVEPPLLSDSDVLFVPLPLSHVFGLNAGLGMALRAGATAVLADRFDPVATLETMRAEAITAVLGVPGQYAAWLRAPGVAEVFSSVRFAMSGSTTLARAVVDGYRDLGVVLHDGYGLTEAAPVVTVNAIGDRLRPNPGSIGRALPGVEVQLRDRDGAVVGPDDEDPGRIFVRGANLFSGYWPDGSGGPGADGWFGTGDIAVYDDDGELHLVGRSTELVIVNGFNVYPAEVEAVFAADPAVAEVAVVGVPDEQTGEAVVAYVVPARGASLDADALLAAAAGRLARFKLPRTVEVVPALPRTVTGKIMKWQLARTP